jgi:hypothetical protein
MRERNWRCPCDAELNLRRTFDIDEEVFVWIRLQMINWHSGMMLPKLEEGCACLTDYQKAFDRVNCIS